MCCYSRLAHAHATRTVQLMSSEGLIPRLIGFVVFYTSMVTDVGELFSLPGRCELAAVGPCLHCGETTVCPESDG
jgi:hypothetical protein